MPDSERIKWAPSLREPRSLQNTPLTPPALTPAVQPYIHPAATPKNIPFQVVPETPAPPPPSGYTMVFSAPSLWMLGLCLMILGATLFTGGVFFGFWLSKPPVVKAEQGGTAQGPAATRTLNKEERLARKALTAVQEHTGGFGLLGKTATGAQMLLKASRPGPGGRAEPGRVPAGQVGASSNKSAEPSSNTRYTIQLGAFVAKENAIDLINKLSGRGVVAFIADGADPTGLPLFFVRMGQFVNFADAEANAKALSAQQNLSAIVIPLEAESK